MWIILRVNVIFVIFIVVGFVRRGLIEVGFSISKVKGYGKKCEMLIGKLIEFN